MHHNVRNVLLADRECRGRLLALDLAHVMIVAPGFREQIFRVERAAERVGILLRQSTKVNLLDGLVLSVDVKHNEDDERFLVVGFVHKLRVHSGMLAVHSGQALAVHADLLEEVFDAFKNGVAFCRTGVDGFAVVDNLNVFLRSPVEVKLGLFVL